MWKVILKYCTTLRRKQLNSGELTSYEMQIDTIVSSCKTTTLAGSDFDAKWSVINSWYANKCGYCNLESSLAAISSPWTNK